VEYLIEVIYDIDEVCAVENEAHLPVKEVAPSI
jgi:hypothetical protein